MLKTLVLASSLLGALAASVPGNSFTPRGAHHGSTSHHSSTTHHGSSTHHSPCHPQTSHTPHKPKPCRGNKPWNRDQWCDYDISTDYTVEPVDTGVIREYWLDISDVVVSPDGVSRTAMAVNGSIPGPTLFADWGDTMKIHVTNSLSTSLNGTSLHWHGIRQNHTNANDGVPSITQCPIAVGDTMTYTWKAEQYGSSWYHSHFALQAYQGVFGGIVINGPASANYDEDLGHIFLNDWDSQTVDELYFTSQRTGPPRLDTGLLNGTNVLGNDGDASQTGSRLNVAFKAGKSYRMRLVNAAVDTHWKFSIDNHTMTVISADLIPVQPYEATYVNIGMGQRYDIIVTANQANVADNFWMRSVPQSACSNIEAADNIKGIVYYGDSPELPTTSKHDWVDSCDDETANLIPYVSKQVSAANLDELSTASVARNSDGLFKWYLNSTTMLVDWQYPTVQSIINGTDDYDAYEDREAVIELAEADQWVYFVVATQMPIPHPIHLHGHDFFVLAQGSGTYNSTVQLNLDNPPRRDTAMLPAAGYLVMAWQTDNPGVWLMHCHIGWHTTEGFAVQFIERASEMTSAVTAGDEEQLEDVCSVWQTFKNDHMVHQEDSGV
ncbi:hypothetical protein G7Z17_g1753 [Cylindrodendrum hubeiense]|uniref:laccase n=1 Tax=Cylindrodendrum hubeiense TaxID=595255 RepID=A0A9P5HL27_9HYPO|nr:hypothetical protein G7Z17_g1753 [Cylindrodendrum hubeiense]